MWQIGHLALPREGEVKRPDEPPKGGRINQAWGTIFTHVAHVLKALICGDQSKPRICGTAAGAGLLKARPMRQASLFYWGNAKPGLFGSSAGPSVIRLNAPTGTITWSPS